MKYYLTVLVLLSCVFFSISYTIFLDSVSLNCLLFTSCVGLLMWLRHTHLEYLSDVKYYNTLAGNTPQMRRLRRLVRIRQAWNDFVEFNEEMAKGAGQAIRG